MTTYILVEGERYEVLDRQIYFEESEAVFIVSNGSRKSYKVHTQAKVLHLVDNSLDATIEVTLG